MDSSLEIAALYPTPPRTEAMRAALAPALNDLSRAVGVRAQAGDIVVRSLTTLSAAEMCGGGDLVAGVLARFSGRIGAVGLFAMEPEAAFELLRDDPAGGDPLDSYTAIGCEILRAVTAALAPDSMTQEGVATLQEDSAIGILLQTHAPSGTAVIAIELSLACADGAPSRAAHVYILVDPKPLWAALSGIAG